MRRPLALTLILLALAALPAAADEAPRLTPSADGRELIDPTAGLAWSRCVEGMDWDGRRCTGTPRLATHAEALAMGRARAGAEGRAWRVPRVTELRRLFERLAHGKSAESLAPAAPAGWYWTSTTRIESEKVNAYSYRNVERGLTQRQVDRLVVQSGWAVEQPGADVRGDVAKREKLAVRLVRTLDPAPAP
ncbi:MULTISPECIES: DUF1566 domain-containing protein [Roseateles]|uniref:DUF1566 domain-containing protein n=1 Tax=Pelomonas caseinilytica TaxID=2906763 RepID=A0ABS8XBM7_9BURK|nr:MULTISPECIES: DUF1566 domain-containing protein [unclassified Roseateles]MCE4535963.1 DUF1566 domain-containing protein [Pelomonas sp. P7]HEV6968542.1 DUF1566 domain-containing protein [Roseateles sp.]